MPVPDFQTVMRPLLVALAERSPRSAGELRDAVADALSVDEQDRAVLLPSGKQTVFANRIGWALSHMGKAELVDRPARGQYALAERGRAVLSEHLERVDMSVLSRFPEYQAFRALRHDEPTNAGQSDVSEVAAAVDLSPSEAVGRLVEEADAAVAVDLLDRILAQPPVFLERLALRVLRALGYGGRETLLEHTGKPGDGGLDGIVRQDALGLDLVGVQAKRYDKESVVHRPELQAFAGALQGAQTSRGVFVTTGSFSSGAKQFADQVGLRIVLIDGRTLTRLMVRYNVGVVVRETFDLKAVDEEFFDDV